MHILLVLLLVLLAPVTAQQPANLRLHSFTSRVFQNTRTLRVLVPAEYDRDPNSRYPVLYLNDGQNLFDSSTSVLNPLEWRVDEVANALIDSGHIVPVIIVGSTTPGGAGASRSTSHGWTSTCDRRSPHRRGGSIPSSSLTR